MEFLVGGSTARMLGFVNAHALNSSTDNEAFYKAIAGADVLLRDGSGMAILYRMIRRDPGFNMNGTDFIPRILAAFRGRKVALWGTTEPYVGRASARCEREFGVQVVSTSHGFRDFRFYLELARATKPDLILLGMGMPKQERLARELMAHAGQAPLIVCGGAILDFLGGRVRRAPPLVRRLGVEWLYRLASEPMRLFRRYAIGNPAFMFRLLLWRGTFRLRRR